MFMPILRLTEYYYLEGNYITPAGEVLEKPRLVRGPFDLRVPIGESLEVVAFRETEKLGLKGVHNFAQLKQNPIYCGTYKLHRIQFLG